MNNHNWLTHIIENITVTPKNKKRLYVLEYFKKKGNDGILSLQESQSIFNNGNVWNDDSNGPVFYSPGTSQSCDVLIAYI